MSQRKRLHLQHGYLSIIAVLLIVVIGFVGTAVAYMISASANSAINLQLSAQALYLADGGLEQAISKLTRPSLTDRTACAGLNISNTLGNGIYSVTATGPFYVSSASTLTGTLSAVATTIPVVNASGYQSMGRIMIDNELINYIRISGNSFLGVTRGVDGSTATSHASGTRVGQYQCTLSSQGGVPSLTAPANPSSPQGKRILQDNVQLQEAWAIGNRKGSNFTLVRWNQPSELAWSNASVAGTNALNGIAMLSYVDAWAVGDNGNFIHWDGNSWSLTMVSPNNIAYESVFCSASNDCHAVGANSGSTPAILHWKGASWTRIVPGGTTAKTDLKSVHCDASNDCWAVGDNKGKLFYRWNGATWTSEDESVLNSYTYNGVFCDSSNDCWAVGKNATFARKNGASWTNFATGLPSAQYNSIFCNSSSDCWAVGNVNSSRDLITHWNGTSWSRDSSNPTPIADLNDVNCVRADDCWAVGATSSGNNPALIHWDGNSWTQATTSGLPTDVVLNGIAIVGPQSHPESGWSESFA